MTAGSETEDDRLDYKLNYRGSEVQVVWGEGKQVNRFPSARGRVDND